MKSRSRAELLRDGYVCDKSMVGWKLFFEHRNKNPNLYLLLKGLIITFQNDGYDHYSIRGLFHIVRYLAIKLEHEIITDYTAEDGSGKRKVKLSNRHSPYYARYLIEQNPDLWPFFSLRATPGDPVEIPGVSYPRTTPIDPLHRGAIIPNKVTDSMPRASVRYETPTDRQDDAREAVLRNLRRKVSYPSAKKNSCDTKSTSKPTDSGPGAGAKMGESSSSAPDTEAKPPPPTN